MGFAGQDEGQGRLVDRPIEVSAAFEDSTEIAEARGLARDFLTSLQAVHGLPVSGRVMGTVQLASRFHEAGCPVGGQDSRKCL